ncbi:Veg family protein [Eubacterium oxidoreducens]|uniref:Uncharacterized protein Veg n=1 Tax=Eubacterium oxidoreducens TaxID=1732 RepID=A0A1G6CDR6_EUBOX|nr:Veg family protein [Eubacterium oxidoreducens]SDB30882.1 Uncharacterized protein Veg [Eubacterium oxidoreducens]
MSNSDFCKVRESVRSQLGNKVMIKQDRGRNRIEIQEGILQNAYPSVFTILIENRRNTNPPQLLSFSYTDIITKEIRMKLC